MKQYRLLDCTLRDGGYLNDWNFGRDTITTIFERLVSAGVDFIEVGFLNESRGFDPERTIQPDTKSFDAVFGGMNKGNTRLVAMIDYGTCALSNLAPCAETCLDGIRVIFKKEKLIPAMAFCKEVKALGYQVFAQLVSITSYDDAELKEAVDLANDVHPYALSMVDSYGLCNAPTLAHYIQIIDGLLDPDICLGYHAHNNFQLGYANAISVLGFGLERDVLVDGTLYGMGKSAGNAPLELLAMDMNLNFGTAYNTAQIQEAISICILDLYHKKPWGYTLFYYIAASNRCHPDYVSFLMNKRTLSVSAVSEILRKIPEEEKLQKNMKLIENLYLEYQKKECDDAEAVSVLRRKLAGKDVLIIGPGRSAQTEREKILTCIETRRPVVIAINYIPVGIPVDYVFLTNARRFLQMSSELAKEGEKRVPVIATSNLCGTEDAFDHVVNFCRLIDETEEFPDNSMKMLIRLLAELSCRMVLLAGLDGYSADTINYFDANKEYSFVKERADSLNGSAKRFFREISDRIGIGFVTKSFYQEQDIKPQDPVAETIHPQGKTYDKESERYN